MRCVVLCALLSFSVPLLADESTRPNFTGTWQLDAAKSQMQSKSQSITWSIHQTSDSISIDLQEEGKKETIKCQTKGKDCDVQEDGQPAKVSFFYNGPILVEMDMIGQNSDHIMKKHLKMSDDGKSMEVEVIHIVPQADKEKWVFTKR